MDNIWEKYAKVLVEYSTNVQKGDLTVIKTDNAQSAPLINEIYKAVLKRGGNPIVRCGIDGITETFFKNATDEQLEFVDEMSKMEYETVKNFISISAPSNVKQLARISPEKQAKRSRATRNLSETLMSRSAKGDANWVIADFPTQALAQEARMSLEDYKQFIINSCYLDMEDPVAKWKEIEKEQQSKTDYLNTTTKIRFVGEKTDITFSTVGRKWINCCGLNNFPDGEIFTSPVEDSANGQIYFDFPAIYRGNEVNKILLTLENGKVVDYKVEQGEDFFAAMINQDEGARFVGEIAIGTNDRIQEITGNILFDEKIGGSIHMALGASYPETGGKNISGLHWDLIKNMKNGGQIYADDKLIYENGKFLI